MYQRSGCHLSGDSFKLRLGGSILLALAGLPLSLQLAGRPFDEATVLRAGHAYQGATDWHRRRPPV